MTSQRFAVTALCTLMLTGCVTTSVDRAIGVSDTGKAYVETLEKVNNLALDKSIEFTANLLPVLPRTEDIFDATTEEIKKRVLLVRDAREYLDNLASYFSELDALAKGDQSDATANALGRVADSLKAEPTQIKLSDEKKKAITGLAGFVAKQAHSAAVEKALKRDADIVAQALAISEKMLDEQIRWIELRAEADRKKNFNDKVKKPFIAGDQLGQDWKNTWSDSVRTPPVISLLVEAKQASSEMQKAWINVLRGQYSYAEIQSSLKNVKAGMDALTTLKDAK
jgi:hypothetical protein